MMISKKKIIISYLLTAVLIFALFLVAVNTGSLKVTPKELFDGLFVKYNKTVATIYDLRFPRIFIAMIGGAAMAVSGVLLQAVMKNPLADPGIIGISSGASFTAVLITAFFPALYFFTPLFAFIGGVAACLLVYSLSWRGGLSPLRIILVGVAVNAMFTGLMSAFNSGTGSNYSGAASIVNANHHENLGRFPHAGGVLCGGVGALAAGLLEVQSARAGGQNGALAGRERKRRKAAHLLDSRTARFHLHGGDRPYKLSRADSSAYRKAAGRL